MIQIAFFISLACTFFAMAFGLVTLFKGGEFNKKYSNAAMRWRVVLQGVTLALFYLMMQK